MSNARDKANIPALNFSSTGIDDNATSTAITIDSNENIGIGETSPTSHIHLKSGGNTKVRFQGNVGGNLSTLLLSHPTTADAGLQFNSNQLNMFSYGDIAFYPSTSNISGSYPNGEVMRIRNNGRVGIGTTSPSNLLHLSSDTPVPLKLDRTTNADSYISYKNTTDEWTAGLDTSEGFVIANGSSITTNPRLTIDSSGNVGIGTSSPVNDSNYTGLTLSGSTGSQVVLQDDGTTEALIWNNNAFNIEAKSTNPIKFLTNNSERMRIDSSGNVGIGETAPLGKLHVKSADSGGTPNSQYDELVLEQNGNNCGMTILCNSPGDGAIYFGDSADNDIGGISYSHFDNKMFFKVNGSERMRIDSSGNVLISKTVNDLGTAGLVLGDLGHVQSTISNSNVIYANRLSTDGDVYRIYQDGGQEGSISVSGSTVSYNGFTGTHWSRFTDNSKPTILRGTVLETLDEMCDWYNLEFDVVTQDENSNDITSSQKIPHVLVDGQSVGDTVTYNHNGTDYQATIVKENDIKHMKSKVSDTVDAKNVYGVFVGWDEDGEGYNDFWVAAVGSFVVRIKANETIAKGDLLQSNGDGTAKVQTDDAVRSSSFAKVLSTTIIETYEDGSYLVPCSLMC